ncbi:elongator complex protein 6 [Hetaerina americana]|uniref:elongator complex protein 6 n=1 Tax=Hetaerina americana TaxID=62018 RepID=UPI003A7F6294
MANDLCMALELDKEELPGKVIAIAENRGSNGNFVISAVICHCIENKIPICLLASHNTFGHYHNVCIKMGGNLQKLKGEGFVKCLDVMKMVESNFTTELKENYILGIGKEELFLKDLFLKLRRDAQNLFDLYHKYPCIIIDDIADFLILGCSASLVLSFFQYCRNMLLEMNGCSLVSLCHNGKDDAESMKVIAGISHMCNIKVEVSGLSTGLSGEVSGVLKVDRKVNDKSPARSTKEYHFKLEERRIVMFSPGTSPAFV